MAIMSPVLDPTVIEATSWRLASELVRRHPQRLRVTRQFPGGGQNDCLCIWPSTEGPGDVRLNRSGTISVQAPFDGSTSDVYAKTWTDHLAQDPREALQELEEAAGLKPPVSVPPSTPMTLTLRVLAAIAASAYRTVHPVEIEHGVIEGETNGDAFAAFPGIHDDLQTSSSAWHGHHGYRYWFVLRDAVPVLAFEQSEGHVWTSKNKARVNLLDGYRSGDRSALALATDLVGLVEKAQVSGPAAMRDSAGG